MRAAIVLMAVALVTACSDPASPEARLRGTIDVMEEAAEAGDRAGFMEHVADDFGGPTAAVDRKGLSDMFRVQILVHTRVSAVVSNMDIEVYGDRATATFHALLTGGPRAWLPDTGRIYRIETGWRLDGSDWELISADWKPLGSS